MTAHAALPFWRFPTPIHTPQAVGLLPPYRRTALGGRGGVCTAVPPGLRVGVGSVTLDTESCVEIIPYSDHDCAGSGRRSRGSS